MITALPQCISSIDLSCNRAVIDGTVWAMQDEFTEAGYLLALELQAKSELARPRLQHTDSGMQTKLA
jgi:hypothetical protein